MADQQNTPAEDKDPEAAQRARANRSLWQLMPKRTLAKGVWLLLMLFAILWFQKQSEGCAKVFTKTMAPGAGSLSPSPKKHTVGLALPDDFPPKRDAGTVDGGRSP